MGLRLSPEGKVGCEFCDTYLEVKIYNCPFKFCPALAMCQACAKGRSDLKSKQGHRVRGCDAQSISLRAEQRKRQHIFHEGEYLLATSTRVEGGLIHAVFRSGTDRKGRFLTNELYERAIKGANTTLREIESWAGRRLPEAPEDFGSPLLKESLAHAHRQFTGEHQPPTSAAYSTLEQFTLF